ncbi:MAG: restriction endonuclease subunit S [Bacteroidales bacterium]|nr:restriction endonuclease subunit S [Bacteroidales bacterium]
MKHNWEYKRLGSLCEIVRGGSPRPIQDFLTNADNGLNWIKIGDVAVGSKYITSTKEKIKPEGLRKTRQVVKGDFILSNSMSFGRPYILKIDGCIHDGWLAIKGVKNHFLPDFLYYFLSSPTTYSLFEKLVKGGVVSNLNSDIVKGISVPVPPMEVQERIVAELDKINETIEDCRELLRNLDALAQSLFYDFFGDPILNQKGWETNTIEQICISIVRGPFGGALKKEIFVPKSHNTYKVYEQKHAIQKNAQIGTYYICENDFKRLKRFELIPGDIIMSCSGTIGEFFKLPLTAEAGVMNQALLKFSLSDKVDSIYFLFLMKDMKRLFNIYGTGLQNISSVTTVKHVSIPVPPLELQKKFAERIEQIEEQKKAVEQTIAELQTLLDSRMDYWFN